MQTLHLVEALVDSGHPCVTVCYFEYDFQMVQLFEQAGSRVVCLSAYGDRPSGNRETYRFLKAGLKRVVNEYRPKVAMVQYMAPGAMPLIILRRLGIKDIVAMLHTDADIYKSLRLVRFLQRHVARLSHASAKLPNATSSETVTLSAHRSSPVNAATAHSRTASRRTSLSASHNPQPSIHNSPSALLPALRASKVSTLPSLHSQECLRICPTADC